MLTPLPTEAHAKVALERRLRHLAGRRVADPDLGDASTDYDQWLQHCFPCVRQLLLNPTFAAGPGEAELPPMLRVQDQDTSARGLCHAAWHRADAQAARETLTHSIAWLSAPGREAAFRAAMVECHRDLITLRRALERLAQQDPQLTLQSALSTMDLALFQAPSAIPDQWSCPHEAPTEPPHTWQRADVGAG